MGRGYRAVAGDVLPAAWPSGVVRQAGCFAVPGVWRFAAFDISRRQTLRCAQGDNEVVINEVVILAKLSS